MSEKLYLVMPAYNEEENIESVVRDWYEVVEDKEEGSLMVIADSGSSDRTHEILVGLQKEMPRLVILSDTLKQHGPKLMSMYKYAIENNADYIFQTDSDGQTSPKEFPAFWEERNSYSMILGNRTVRGDGKSRAFVEHVVCFLLRLFFGVKVPDANAPFRLMKTEIVAKYIDKLPADYFIPNIMFTTYSVYYKEKVTFKEISFRSRQAGTNSINIKKIVKIGFTALKDFWNFKKDMKKNPVKV